MKERLLIIIVIIFVTSCEIMDMLIKAIHDYFSWCKKNRMLGVVVNLFS